MCVALRKSQLSVLDGKSLRLDRRRDLERGARSTDCFACIRRSAPKSSVAAAEARAASCWPTEGGSMADVRNYATWCPPPPERRVSSLLASRRMRVAMTSQLRPLSREIFDDLPESAVDVEIPVPTMVLRDDDDYSEGE